MTRNKTWYKYWHMAILLIKTIRIRHVSHCWIHTRELVGKKGPKRCDWGGLKYVHKKFRQKT